MLYSVDIETACDVPGCVDFGKSICREDHSLSPWHSRITVVAAVTTGSERVFRGPRMLTDLRAHLEADLDYAVTGHAFKFDWLHLARHGFEIPLERWTADSQLAAYTLTDKIPDAWLADYEAKRVQQPGHHRKAGKHSLKTLAPFFLDVPAFWEANGHDNDEYVLKDARYSLQLTKLLEGRLHERDQFDFYKESLLPWTKMLLQAEWRGIEIDMQAMEAKRLELSARAIQLKSELDKLWAPAHIAYQQILVDETIARYEAMKARNSLWERRRAAALAKLPDGIDLDSPKQVAWLLRDYLGYSITSLDGSESTGKEVLERLASEGNHDVATYLEWRKTNKILTAFLPTYAQLAVKDGDRHIIHPNYNPTNTRTGRTSSERPNMQQVPPQLRPLFKARKGYKLIGYDAASIEAKLIALYSQDPTLYSVIRDGISIHDQNTKVFFGLDCPHEDIKKLHADKRAAAKNCGFALFYNAGANRIRIAFAQKGYHLSQAECRQIHERFKKSYATALEYSREIVNFMEGGEVLTNLLGRPLRIENADDAYMQAFNTLIQSSASDLNLYGAWLADQTFKREGIEAYPLLFVHDFVAFEVADRDVERADEIMRHKLVDFDLQTDHGPIKLEIDGGVSDRWIK